MAENSVYVLFEGDAVDDDELCSLTVPTKLAVNKNTGSNNSFIIFRLHNSDNCRTTNGIASCRLQYQHNDNRIALSALLV